MAAAGAPGVPAGVPLQADLALLSWKHVEDLSGDGGVIKKTLHDPEGWDVRTPGCSPPAPRLRSEGGCGGMLCGLPSGSPLAALAGGPGARCDSFCTMVSV
jgi:hypothetical protein